MNIKKPDAIINEVKEVVSRWKYFAGETMVKKELMEAIEKTLILI